MPFLDTLGQLSSIGGAVTGNPWAAGVGAAINLFTRKSTDPAVGQYQNQARQYGAQADAANGYYTSEAAAGKNQENSLIPQYQQAFHDALNAHQGGYYWGNQNYSQARAQNLQNSADATNSAYQRASANSEANMLSRGLTGSSMDAGTQAYLASQQARSNSQNVMGLNNQMNQQAIGAADYTANAYQKALNDATSQAGNNTAKGLNYDVGQENANYSRAQAAQTAQNASNTAFNTAIAELGKQVGLGTKPGAKPPAKPGAKGGTKPGAKPKAIASTSGVPLSQPTPDSPSASPEVTPSVNLNANATSDPYGNTPAPLTAADTNSPTVTPAENQ